VKSAQVVSAGDAGTYPLLIAGKIIYRGFSVICDGVGAHEISVLVYNEDNTGELVRVRAITTAIAEFLELDEVLQEDEGIDLSNGLAIYVIAAGITAGSLYATVHFDEVVA